MAEKLERIASHIPYPELYAPDAVDHQLTLDLLGSRNPATVRGIPHDRSSEAGVTPIDLRRTPRRLTDQQILGAVSAHLDIPEDVLTARARSDGKGAQREKAYTEINIALREAHTYIDGVLGLTVPTAQVHSPEEIIALIRKTSRYRDTNRKSLGEHAGYCALISVALAVFEIERKEAHTLKMEMGYVERFLTESSGANEHQPLFSPYYAIGISGPMTAVVSGITPQCQVRVSMRDKTPKSQITKYLMKPEATAESAQKDAIGIRIEVANKRIEDVLVASLNYVQEHLEAAHLIVEDRNLLGVERLDEFKDRKSEEVHDANQIPVVPDTSPLSADSLRAVKITGKINIPKNGTSHELISRPIELQVVEPENKNESGLSSHAVYELKKKITVMSRLFGGCSQRWLEAQTTKIAQTEGFPEGFVSNTIQGLQDVGFLIKLPGTEKKKVYAASDVYRRWLSVDGLITDKAIRKQVMHALP